MKRLMATIALICLFSISVAAGDLPTAGVSSTQPGDLPTAGVTSTQPGDLPTSGVASTREESETSIVDTLMLTIINLLLH